ncbi:hypothetical protein BGX33_002148 [Mortierella sp. NVP41]|nr:hypothetical protein BGX33_002148 [Mortierella sp. NVP41]
MFAAHSPASASSGQANDTTDSWVNNHSTTNSALLLSAQDVLDYSSFSDRSNSPVLSIQSLASEQHSPNLDAYCFNDFAPSSSSSLFEQALQDQTIAATTKSSASETARQAALLHAYLAAQNLAYTQQLQQQRWDFTAMSQLETVTQAQVQLQEAEEAKRREQQEQLAKTQQTDAQNLARYLSQLQKEEASSQEEDMDKADAASDTISAPPSPSSTTSTHIERSPSPESSCQDSSQSSKALKSSRKLVCFNCNVTQTPLWRRTPDRKHSLCNACGLYYKQYGAHRPLNVRHKLPTVLADVRMSTLPYTRPHSGMIESSSSSSSESDSDSGSNTVSLPALTKMYSEALLRPAEQKISPPLMTAKQGIECANCSQTQTPLWRKNDAGEPICNACGLYAKLHKRARPVTMRKSKISRRRRDWGGNLAQQAQAQAQALAMVHVQVQAQVQAQVEVKDASAATGVGSAQEPRSVEASLIQEMSRRAQVLQGRSAPSVHSSDSEEEMEVVQQSPQQQQQEQGRQPAVSTPAATAATATTTAATGSVAQKLSGNAIMDETKFSDMVSQMNAHQMNRFLSILESRCGVLRNRLLASTEPDQSSLDHLF